jgi:hypothetical protein
VAARPEAPIAPWRLAMRDEVGNAMLRYRSPEAAPISAAV